MAIAAAMSTRHALRGLLLLTAAIRTLAAAVLVNTADLNQEKQSSYRILYQAGLSEEDLPLCSKRSVCNKVDTYERPWIERQCRCPTGRKCSTSLDPNDGFTVLDKTRQFKLCEAVIQFPQCRYFRDVAWTFTNYPDNITEQVIRCTCPKTSIAYITKREAFQTQTGIGYEYFFACSPQSHLRCQRKEPCRLFTVKKRHQVEEVNSNTLCQCPYGHRCPRHHLEANVIAGRMYDVDSVRTFSGYCM